MQGDEMDEMVDIDHVIIDEMVETVQMVDKWLFLMIAFTNNDALM